MRILLVEDERRISGFLVRGLREEGHVVDLVEDLAQAKTALGEHAFELLLVDRMLPDGDGLQLVRDLRKQGNYVPAICITARDRVEERVEGLYGGADDYLIKPFAFDELLARMAAVTRRGAATQQRLAVGDLSIDLDAHKVFRGDQEIGLTPQEFRLLRYLAEHRGRVLSRSRLLEGVWDIHHDPGTNVVDVYVGYLRQKIDKGFERPLLHTVRGFGYVLEDRS